MVLGKLAISNLAQHRARTALTVAAIALSVSLVVSVTTGYRSVLAFADRFLQQYLGSTDAQIVRGKAGTGVPEELMDRLREDPAVLRVTPRLEMQSIVLGKKREEPNGHHRPISIVGILRPDDRQVDTLRLVEGAWFEGSAGNVTVIDQAVARRYEVGVGDELTIPRPEMQLRLKIVGVVHKPDFLADHVMQAIYVPLETLQQILPSESEGQVGRILIELKPGSDAEAFAQRSREALVDMPGEPKITLTTEARARMHENLRGLYVLSYLGGAVSLLAATFIIFSSLSMGVAERSRTLAMLRAIGAYRSQLGGLVMMEGVGLSLTGILIGVPLGWVWVRLLSAIPRFTTFFPDGVVMDWLGVGVAMLAALVAALGASLLPALTAMRLDPLEAMTASARPPGRWMPVICAITGVVLIALDSYLLAGGLEWTLRAADIPQADYWARRIAFVGHYAIGLPGIMVGFFLLAPLVVIGVERVLGPIVAAALGLRYALLRQQLSTGVWRAAGTAAALMVGLATLVGMQTQGNTIIGGWRLPDRFPDLFIVDINPFGGLTIDQVQKLEQVPGIKPGEVMAIAIASPQLGSSLASIAMLGVVPDATMFFGVDPDKGFQMMELDFREGDPQEAWEKLKQGRHLLVTNEFKRLQGLGVGDKFPLKTRNGVVDYTIAGVVWSPGLDVVKSIYDVGSQFDQRTAFSVFGTLEDARRDFGVERLFVFAANIEVVPGAEHGISRDQILENIRKHLGGWGFRAGDVRQIKHHIQTGLRNVLMLASTVAFAAMVVASLGVTNTIMASIRTRRWQFGVLRSIGVTRWQLLRLVLAEAMLLGLVGVALGLGAGLIMGHNARLLSIVALGYDAPLQIPWHIVQIGAAVVMAIALLASVWPAMGVARREPLSLLQAGRAST